MRSAKQRTSGRQAVAKACPSPTSAVAAAWKTSFLMSLQGLLAKDDYKSSDSRLPFEPLGTRQIAQGSSSLLSRQLPATDVACRLHLRCCVMRMCPSVEGQEGTKASSARLIGSSNMRITAAPTDHLICTPALRPAALYPVEHCPLCLPHMFVSS